MDTWVETGSHVTPYYDSLLAKLMVFAPTRTEAIAKLVDALGKTKVRSGSGVWGCPCWHLALGHLRSECVGSKPCPRRVP